MNGFPHRCVGVIFMPLFRPFRAGVFVTIRPRALPWAITFSPVGAEQGQVGGSHAVPSRRWPVCPVAAMAVRTVAAMAVRTVAAMAVRTVAAMAVRAVAAMAVRTVAAMAVRAVAAMAVRTVAAMAVRAVAAMAVRVVAAMARVFRWDDEPSSKSPKGAPCDSPGQRPGKGHVICRALKGRN